MSKFYSVAPVMAPQSPFDQRSSKIAVRQQDFFDGFQPIYLFLRSLGLMPFSIKRSANGNILGPKVNKFDGVWFVTTMFIYSLASFVSFNYVKFNIESSTNLHMVVISTNLHLTFGLLFCVVIIAMDMYNRAELVNLLKKFTIFDKRVSYTYVNNVFDI